MYDCIMYDCIMYDCVTINSNFKINKKYNKLNFDILNHMILNIN